jgi:YVTN family beta-propeller protein
MSILPLSTLNKAWACPPDPKGDVVFDKNCPLGSSIVLDAALFNVSGDPLSYEWFGPFSMVEAPGPAVFIPEGTYSVTLYTNDGLKRSAPHTLFFSIDPEYYILPIALKRKVALTWLPVKGAQGYDIYRAPDSDPANFRKIAELGPSAIAYTDPNLNDSTYLYTLGVLINGSLSFSHIASAHPFLTLPKLNYPPVIYSPPVIPAIVNLPYTYKVLATDPQFDILTYSLINPPSGMTINPFSGCIQWTPPSMGDYEITVKVRDIKGTSVYQTFVIEVDDLPPIAGPPIARADGPYSGGVNQTITFDGSASTDPSGYALTYYWDFGDGTTGSGVITTHKYTSSGTYVVKLTVTNSKGKSSSDTTQATIHCQAPAVSFSSNPSAVKRGESCSLIWTTEAAQIVSIDNGIGQVSVSGSISISPQSTTTYTITASGPCGETAKSVTITVYQPPAVSISALPLSIFTGQSSKLSWTSTNAVTVSIDNNVGIVDAISSLLISPSQTTTYTITATGPGGIATAGVTVIVTPPQPPTVTLTASPISLVQGSPSTLTWSSTNADAVSIDQGVGSVSPNGSLSVTPSQTTTYNITAQGPGGAATASATINVINNPTVSITASPDHINAGDTTTLTWEAGNADSVSIDNDIGEVDGSGSLDITLLQNTTFTITATGPGGTAAAQVTVHVNRGTCAYIPNNEESSISVVDISTNHVIATIPVDISPYGVAVSPDGDLVYVACPGGNGRIHVIDANSNTVTGIIDEIYANTLAVSPDGSTIYAVSGADGILTSMNADTYEVINETDIGTSPHGIAVTPDGSRIYITSLWEGNIRVIDASNLNVINTIDLTGEGSAVYDVKMSPDGSLLYAIGSYALFVIDAKTNSVISSKALFIERSLRNPNLAVSPDGSKLSLSFEGSICIVDLNSLAVTNETYAGRPSSMTFTPDGTFIYVPDHDLNKVLIIDADSGSENSTIQDPSFYGPLSYGQFIAEHKELVSGRIVMNGKGIAGITVALSHGTLTRSFITDEQGRYFFYAPNGQYTLSFSKNGHTYSQQDVNVNVNNAPVALPDTEVLIEAIIWINPTSIASGGSAALQWNSSNTTSLSIDQGIGAVASSGSIIVSPAETTTYTITATDDQGRSVTGQATLTVFQPPTVSIAATPNPVIQGENVTISWTSTNADSVSIDAFGSVDTSGYSIEFPESTTTYTITATGPGGTATASVTVTVNFPPLTITSPAGGNYIHRPDIMVTGTVDSPLTDEIQVTVNGMPAILYGSAFVVNHIPLQDGSNTITAKATDNHGHSVETSITVTAYTTGPYTTISSDDYFGSSPIDTTIRVNPAYSYATTSLNVTGPGQVNYSRTTDNSTGTLNYVYDTEINGQGIYYITAVASLDSQHNYRDTIGIVVFDPDSSIKAKWNEMKSKLINGDIDGALNYFTPVSQNKYQQIFTLLGGQLPGVASGMADIEQVYAYGYKAKYRIKKNELINGVNYLVTHYIYFVMDPYGNWYIDSF